MRVEVMMVHMVSCGTAGVWMRMVMMAVIKMSSHTHLLSFCLLKSSCAGKRNLPSIITTQKASKCIRVLNSISIKENEREKIGVRLLHFQRDFTVSFV